MDKIEIGFDFSVPMPVVLVGTQVKGKVNFMTVAWCTRANSDPPMIVCGINRMNYTPEGIVENGTFSVNLPSASLVEKTDYCGLVSGERVDKTEVFEVFHGILDNAPMIRACPVTLECRLVHTLELPTNFLFVGEICGAYADAHIIKDNRPDFEAIDPLILTMPDNTYHHLGSTVGEAWNTGKGLIKRT
ncbi:flavin reductase family protein [Methanoregula sp.]|uniref:flavin reductase family protein n=1 Tax=Methanoregula sp. TaxID=2052170 RepID=UPI003BB09A54